MATKKQETSNGGAVATRVQWRVEVSLVVRVDGKYQGYVVRNVSLGGCFLTGVPLHRMGDSVQLAIEFDEGIWYGLGKVVRVRSTRVSPALMEGIALSFIDISAASHAHLEELIEAEGS